MINSPFQAYITHPCIIVEDEVVPLPLTETQDLVRILEIDEEIAMNSLDFLVDQVGIVFEVCTNFFKWHAFVIRILRLYLEGFLRDAK